MRRHRRENKILKGLIRAAAGVAACIAGLILFLYLSGGEGSIRVYDYDGCCIYAYYGEIKINNDGRDGKQIDIECAGYLEGYQQHGTPESGGVHDE